MSTMATKSTREQDQIGGRLHDRAVSAFNIAKLEEAYLKLIA